MKNRNGIYPESFFMRLPELEKKIGYTYKSKEYLYNALTHSSFANEYYARTKKALDSNERFEFLGDSVLSIAVSGHIFNTLSYKAEGDLTRIRAFSVCEDALYQFALSIELGEYLALGRGEEKTDGRKRKSILADATEALIASIYLDSGCSLESVKPLVMRIAEPRIDEIIKTFKRGGTKNYKGDLQQLIQISRGDVLEYECIGESGPDHRKTFNMQVKLNSNVIGVGVGTSKQEAEQNAAKEALKLFGEKV